MGRVLGRGYGHVHNGVTALIGIMNDLTTSWKIEIIDCSHPSPWFLMRAIFTLLCDVLDVVSCGLQEAWMSKRK